MTGSAMRAKWVLLVLCGLSGCDKTAGWVHIECQYPELYVLGAVPYRMVTGDDAERVEPVCRPADGPADGLLLRILYKGTQQKEGLDLDQGLRPGDKVAGKALTVGRFAAGFGGFSLSCIEQSLPAASRCSSSGDCAVGEVCDPAPGKGFCVDGLSDCYSGARPGGLDIADVSYRAHIPERGTPVGVAILVDMSGSNRGLTMRYPPYREVDNEAAPGGPVDFSLVDLAQCASDINGTRFSAVKTIIENLNPDDRFIIFGFNEYGIEIPCELPAGSNGGFLPRALLLSPTHGIVGLGHGANGADFCNMESFYEALSNDKPVGVGMRNRPEQTVNGNADGTQYCDDFYTQKEFTGMLYGDPFVRILPCCVTYPGSGEAKS